MEFNISDANAEETVKFDLEIKVNDLKEKDYRCDLFLSIVSTAITTIGEYIQEMPESDKFKFDKDGVLSPKDTNICLNNFKQKHLDNFIDMMKKTIQSIEYCEETEPIIENKKIKLSKEIAEQLGRRTIYEKVKVTISEKSRKKPNLKNCNGCTELITEIDTDSEPNQIITLCDVTGLPLSYSKRCEYWIN